MHLFSDFPKKNIFIFLGKSDGKINALITYVTVIILGETNCTSYIPQYLGNIGQGNNRKSTRCKTSNIGRVCFTHNSIMIFSKFAC